MRSKKVFFIVSEKRERIRIQRRARRVVKNNFCKTCEKTVGWLTFDEVSTLTKKSLKEIREECENGKFDIRTADDGRIFVCLESLFR